MGNNFIMHANRFWAVELTWLIRHHQKKTYTRYTHPMKWQSGKMRFFEVHSHTLESPNVGFICVQCTLFSLHQYATAITLIQFEYKFWCKFPINAAKTLMIHKLIVSRKFQNRYALFCERKNLKGISFGTWDFFGGGGGG